MDRPCAPASFGFCSRDPGPCSASTRVHTLQYLPLCKQRLGVLASFASCGCPRAIRDHARGVAKPSEAERRDASQSRVSHAHARRLCQGGRPSIANCRSDQAIPILQTSPARTQKMAMMIETGHLFPSPSPSIHIPASPPSPTNHPACPFWPRPQKPEPYRRHPIFHISVLSFHFRLKRFFFVAAVYTAPMPYCGPASLWAVLCPYRTCPQKSGPDHAVAAAPTREK